MKKNILITGICGQDGIFGSTFSKKNLMYLVSIDVLQMIVCGD